MDPAKVPTWLPNSVRMFLTREERFEAAKDELFRFLVGQEDEQHATLLSRLFHEINTPYPRITRNYLYESFTSGDYGDMLVAVIDNIVGMEPSDAIIDGVVGRLEILRDIEGRKKSARVELIEQAYASGAIYARPEDLEHLLVHHTLAGRISDGSDKCSDAIDESVEALVTAVYVSAANFWTKTEKMNEEVAAAIKYARDRATGFGITKERRRRLECDSIVSAGYNVVHNHLGDNSFGEHANLMLLDVREVAKEAGATWPVERKSLAQMIRENGGILKIGKGVKAYFDAMVQRDDEGVYSAEAQVMAQVEGCAIRMLVEGNYFEARQQYGHLKTLADENKTAVSREYKRRFRDEFYDSLMRMIETTGLYTQHIEEERLRMKRELFVPEHVVDTTANDRRIIRDVRERAISFMEQGEHEKANAQKKFQHDISVAIDESEGRFNREYTEATYEHVAGYVREYLGFTETADERRDAARQQAMGWMTIARATITDKEHAERLERRMLNEIRDAVYSSASTNTHYAGCAKLFASDLFQGSETATGGRYGAVFAGLNHAMHLVASHETVVDRRPDPADPNDAARPPTETRRLPGSILQR